MKLSRHAVWLIVGLIVLALGGLMLVQASLIATARQLEAEAFQQNVMAALSAAAQKLETTETAGRMFVATSSSTLRTDTLPPGELVREEKELRGQLHLTDSFSFQVTTTTDSVARWHASAALPVVIEDEAIRYRVPVKQHVRVLAFSTKTGKDTILVDTVKLPGDYRINFSDAPRGAGSFMFKYAGDSATVVMHIDSSFQPTMRPTAVQVEMKQGMVQRMADRLVLAELEPIERRVEPRTLEATLASAFKESGVELDYAYGVMGPDDSLRLAEPSSYREQLQSSPLRARLFPNDLFAAANDLVVYFPGERLYIWRRVTPLLSATAAFMLIIMFCFAYTIRTIVRQRRFAERTVEFINNMTHEFKTPISTVALAAEALMSSEAAADARVGRYGRMILDENHRMRGQVEKILQMAVLEEGDYELRLVDIDLHEVIEQAMRQISLHVEQRQGIICRRLEAEHHLIKADPVHLANIISNLLDNANKYSPDKPAITVSTHNAGGEIVMRIQDNGIGIREKDIRQVFDKFYRVPSGNVHNVRGFGIGLSYVKLMVEALGGRIRIESTPGAGTTVEISLPVVEISGATG